MASEIELLVEGKNDKHVIKALCDHYDIALNFNDIIVGEYLQGEPGGIDALLKGIPLRLKRSGIQVLGVVVDANEDIQRRWQAVCNRLYEAGFSNLPDRPVHGGCIITASGKPSIGIWVMPNNELAGMLEDFVAFLIPQGDNLAPRAEEYLERIESDGLNRYRSQDRPKAFIHTWLAVQEAPGRPMGLSITARVLNPDSPIASEFVDWLRRLLFVRQ